MLKRIYLLTAALLLSTGISVFAQTSGGSIKGKVIDKATKEPLPFANVVVEMNGTQAAGGVTDFDGNFHIKPLQPGKYSVKATFVGYTAAEVTGVIVSTDKITFQDISLAAGGVDITAVEVSAYNNPIIDKGNPSSQTTLTQEQIQVAPTRDVRSVASTTAGIYQQDEGSALNVRGSRSNATDFYIDGIKVRGSTNIPQAGIEQVTVVTGGVPAQYGDATGGIINITTRGPSNEFFGGVEYVTSELFDDYGYNLIGMNLSGPILAKKDEDGNKTGTMLGFFVSGEYQLETDRDPSAVGMYKVKDDVFEDLKNNPLTSASAGGTVFQLKSEFLTDDDFEKINIKQNTKSNNYRISGKLDFQPADNITLTFGGSFDKIDRNNYIGTYSLYNFDNNNDYILDTWRVFGRITHKLGRSSASSSNDESASVIKNAFYSVQVDYTQTKQIFQNTLHEDRFFDYGYIGKFESVKALTANQFSVAPFNIDTLTGDTLWTMQNPNTGQNITTVQSGLPQDTIVNFTGGGVNPLTQAYTDQYYNLADGNYQTYNTTLAQISTNGGILNGQRPRNTYALYRSTGYTYNAYNELETTQLRFVAQVSADIKDHAITAGFEYEQRSDRNYAIGPVGLWGLMRLRANEHIQQLDLNNPVYAGDSIYYDRLYTGDNLPGFYENLRAKLGVDLATYIDLDALDRSNFSLDLFTADEILNSGNNLAAWYGYDYKGNKTSSNPSFDEFWTARDANGNFTRPIGAFEPVYMAGYIQDKFAINDLIFNVGVRVDRYDANQQVLKDKYLLYPAMTAGQVQPDRPGNIKDDFIVYVTDVNSPNVDGIIGYRDGDTWYDANGVVVANPNLLALQAGGEIAPWLVNTALANNGVQTDQFKPSDTFKDYDPQVTISPRVAFSFPISDEALFFAHYDVLTQRPASRSRSNPLDYYYMESQGSLLNNPNLKPEKTTDYELGFKQTLSKSSAITISGFYRELRDQIQQTRVNFAYPISYLSFSNIDFGTVKGLTFGYDLRRTSNIRINASYTLQFADGTGSGDRTSNKLLANGLPNLRVIFPLDFDQRHNLVATVDYRYSSGKAYNGPMIKNTQIFANAGLNVVFRAGSGTPYSRQREVTTQANNLGLQQISSGTLDGSVNGSRLPWQFRVDIRFDKDFDLNFGKGDNAKSASLNIYVQIQNLFDTRNIINVYSYTGNPDDDGYLSSAVGQSIAPQQTSPSAFVDQYNIKVNNPNNYSLPRRARIGVQLNF
jgi:outer membrane receptor protein involved in Fe transport